MEWIKLNEKKPRIGEEVILFNGIVRTGYSYTERGDFENYEDVTFFCYVSDATHWQPLPPPPAD